VAYRALLCCGLAVVSPALQAWGQVPGAGDSNAAVPISSPFATNSSRFGDVPTSKDLQLPLPPLPPGDSDNPSPASQFAGQANLSFPRGDAVLEPTPPLVGYVDSNVVPVSQPSFLPEPTLDDRPPYVPEIVPEFDPSFRYPTQPPAGFTGRSGVLPREGQSSAHFVPMEDRWRIPVPEWDRYDKDHPLMDDYPYDLGSMFNPYKQNVLKGDYPIIGQHTFFNFTATNFLLTEYRQLPTPANAFEVAQDPNQFNLFGDPNQFFVVNNTSLSFDLSHGDSSFKPADWRVRLTPVFNENYLDVQELGIITPNPADGRVRYRTDIALQEWFVESKLMDLSADYDFLSMRIGSQPFISDFRGFLFADTNRAIRLFGTRHSNREQFNLAFFSQQEKQTNSLLNTWGDRGQDIWVANWFRQDTFFPGYTALLNFHYVHDEPTMTFDANGFLVRPDPVGVFQRHAVRVAYLGWGGDGHIGETNITHQFYQALGQDTLNPIAGSTQDINAQMFALELSRDRDWIRFRASYFFASGDDDPFDHSARGFDTILDNPAFAGGQTSFWQRQGPGIFGVGLKNRLSLVPDLRSNKVQGQLNFVNPGVQIVSAGVDLEITQTFRILQNVNAIWFDQTGALRQFIFQSQVRNFVGTDVSVAAEYRPLLSNNIIFLGGFAMLVPGSGFRDIYDNVTGPTQNLYSAFLETTLQF
jgi:hypothetical protein